MKQASKYKSKSLKHQNKVTNVLDLITLNVDVINMSDAHPFLIRGCLYKETAIYYFIGGVLDFDP